jgi:acetoacetyl-CoA synthetase
VSRPCYRKIARLMPCSDLDVSATEPGLPGELICKKAFPIEPLGFWPLPGYGFPEEEVKKAQERFQESYFKDAKGTWCAS